jgi:hypothetical protein
MAFDLESKCFEAFGFSLQVRVKNKLFHHDRLSIMPIWSMAHSAVRAFGDKPSGEGVGGLPEPGVAGVGELAAPS